MKRFLMILATAAALSGPGAVLAQTAAVAPPVVLPPSASDPGYPERLQLADQLIQAAGGRKQMETIITSIMAGSMQSIAKSMPEKQRALFERIQARQQEIIIGLLPEMIDVSKRAYASTFTEQELKDILAFQRSPSGQAMIRKTPQMTATMLTQFMPIIIQQMPKMMNAVVVEVCDEQRCTDDDRRTIVAAMAKALPAPPAS